MGCQQSTAIREHESDITSSKVCTSSILSGSTRSGSTQSISDDEITRTISDPEVRRCRSTYSVASQMSSSTEAAAFDRLRQLRELDQNTKVPFIIVELRGLGHRDGYIAICGKDEYGVYSALDQWLTKTWRCTKLNVGDVSDDTSLPFCDAMYRWESFVSQGEVGTNNMGLSSMQLVDFMCGELSWTLGMINGGNVGEKGEMREQQIIFRAPHPMNIVSHHMMIKLRSVGFIEVCGSDHDSLRVLHKFFSDELGAQPQRGHDEICDFCYSCQKFKSRGKNGDNNLGLLTTQVCDAVVSLLPGWSLTTMNGGNSGEDGSDREQRLVFRWDNHPLRENPHLLVELKEAGYVQVSGKDVDGIYGQLEKWLGQSWACKNLANKRGQEAFCNKLFTWKAKDMLVATAELTGFFHKLGWQMQVSSQGIVTIDGNRESQEHQILFRPHQHGGEGVVEPHIFVELYTGEGVDELYSKPNMTQLPGNQRIRICSVGNCNEAEEELEKFVFKYFDASRESFEGSVRTYLVDVFLCRGLMDSNLAMVTQRFRDFMVDRLGWRLLVCNVCNRGRLGVFREQQLVFRYDGERREIPPVKEANIVVDWPLFTNVHFPSYWQSKQVLKLKQPVAIVSCDADEIKSLQDVFDDTFKRILTRDRVYDLLGESEEMPFRLEVVHAFRSEHAELYRRFTERRSEYTHSPDGSFHVKTQRSGKFINDRLGAGESLLFHGTNPSSAMGILKTGFALDHAGKSTGTMLGYGVYLAECSSKSDEYARDDGGGTYPGLMALLVCRCLVGKPYIVHEAGDHVTGAKKAGSDCVVGDRESKVGTYREFVMFDERQVLPEYAVIYRRQYDKSKVPTSMHQAVRGTTGKNWQVHLEGKRWGNLTPDVTNELNKAQLAGHTSFERRIGEHIYKFDLANMERHTHTHTHTDVVCKLRAPMRH